MDVIQTFAHHLRQQGVAASVIDEVTRIVRVECGGQSQYIHKNSSQQRDGDIRADFKRGYPISRLASKYQLSERRIREIIG